MTQPDKEKKCCKKCRQIGNTKLTTDGRHIIQVGNQITCANTACPCHTTASDRTFEEKEEDNSGRDAMREILEEAEVGEWEEEFYKLAKTMDGQYRPRLKVLIEELRQRAYEEGHKEGANTAFRSQEGQFEAGKQAMRQELMEEFADIPRIEITNKDWSKSRVILEHSIRIHGFLLKDTGSSNK